MQTNSEEFNHYTVLKQEAVDALNCQDGKIYIDATLGGGGHTSLIAEKILPQGRVIGFEVDEIAIKKAKEVLKEHNIEYTELLANNNVDLCRSKKIMVAPTLVDGDIKYTGLSSIIKYCEESYGTSNTIK